MKELTQGEILNHLEDNPYSFIYLYTPLCGTCKLASRILTVVEEAIDELSIISGNLNYMEGIAEAWKIESVPCFLIFKNGQIMEQVYAIQSVDNMYKIVKEYIGQMP